MKNRKIHTTAGDAVGAQKLPNGLRILTDRAFLDVVIYSSDVLRFIYRQQAQEIEYSFSTVQMPQNVSFDVQENATEFIIQTEALDVHVSRNHLSLQIKNKQGVVLNEDDASLGCGWIGDEVTCYKKVQEGERFIGLGEKNGNLDRKGKAFTNWNTDYFAYPVDGDPLYCSIPFFIGIHSNTCYGIYMDNSHKSVFNFGASNRRFIYFQASDGPMDYYFINGPKPADVLQKYTWLTGTMQLPPLWSMGFQQCRYSYYPDSEVLTLAQNFRNRNIPADVVYLDIHYMQDYKVFTWDNERFSNPKQLAEQMREMGFKLITILDPGIKTDTGYDVFNSAQQNDVLVKYPDGELYEGEVWPGWSAFPDFTSEKGRAWWADQMKGLIDTGISGFWTDMNEPATWGQHMPDCIEFDYENEGAAHKKARNVYGMQMARATRDGALSHKPDERPFVLTRAGFAGVQRFAAVWTGDNVSTDEHMLAGVRLVNSLGISGVAFSGYDVGGFAGESGAALYARWIQIGAFSPFFRGHSMINTRDAEPWAFGEEVEEIARNFIQLRYRLIPYLYSVFYEASKTGMPVQRSLALDYTFDHRVYKNEFQNQYMFGPAVLVAPLRSDAQYHKIFLPQGLWYDVYTDKQLLGDAEPILEYPIERAALWIKAGSIIPMQKCVPHLSSLHKNDTLELHFYLGADGEFQYYEDDGSSFDYRSGAYLQRNMRISGNTIYIEAAQGNYASRFSHFKCYFHGCTKNTLQINGREQEMKTETYRFIDPVSDFDPFSRRSENQFEISNLHFTIIEAPTALLTIEF
jgi:alpha-glucosidase